MKTEGFITKLRDAGLPEPLIDTIVCVGQLVNIKSQTKLIEAGKKCRVIYFILKGAFVCRHLNGETGDKRTIAFHRMIFSPL